MMQNNTITPPHMPIDLPVEVGLPAGNPFLVRTFARFEGPEGRSIKIPVYYDGEGGWKVRFSAPIEGTWRYAVVIGDSEASTDGGTVECRGPTLDAVHGGLRVDPANRHHFVFEDGTPYFMLAYECDWLWAMGFQEGGIDRIRKFLKTLSGFGFNGIIMNVFGYDTGWAPGKTSDIDYGPPDEIPWAGTHEHPDYLSLNPRFFYNFDQVMRVFLEEGFTAHLYFKVYNKKVNWPANGSPGDDLYFSYVAARYQAFPNVLWDYSKETYYEPDKEYVKGRIGLVRGLDAYRRPWTVHDDLVFTHDPRYTDTLDFVTLQRHTDFHWSILYERERKDWPVLNAEFSYEARPGHESDPYAWTAHAAEEVADRAYKIVMAGGYLCYYYDGTAFDVIEDLALPIGYGYMKILSDFFTSIEWYAMEPHPEYSCYTAYCLADTGWEYIFYTSPKQKLLVNLLIPPDRNVRAIWVDTRKGSRENGTESRWWGEAASPGLRMFVSPFDVPALLHLKTT